MKLTSEKNYNIEPAALYSGEIKLVALLIYVFFMFIYLLITLSAAMLLLTNIKSGNTDYWLIGVYLSGVYLILCLSRLPFRVKVNNGKLTTYSIRGKRMLNLPEAKSVNNKTAIYSATFLKKSNFTVLKIVDSAGKVGFLNTYVLKSANKTQFCTGIVAPLRKAGISNLRDDGVDIWVTENG